MVETMKILLKDICVLKIKEAMPFLKFLSFCLPDRKLSHCLLFTEAFLPFEEAA